MNIKLPPLHKAKSQVIPWRRTKEARIVFVDNKPLVSGSAEKVVKFSVRFNLNDLMKTHLVSRKYTARP